MGRIKLKAQVQSTTSVSNSFIDDYMTDANEAQIKIYLYLLRCIGSNMPVSVGDFADRFNYTEKDILRSLMYWGKKGLLSIDYDNEGNVVAICVNDVVNSPVSEIHTLKEKLPEADRAAKEIKTQDKPENEKSDRTVYSEDALMSFKSSEDVKDIIYMTERYIGRTLNSNDINSLLFMYDSLKFPLDLLEFLIEYCVNKGHKTMRYIEKTAMGWKDDGIDTLQKARAHTSGDGIKAQCYAVFKALGIKNRSLTETDLQFVGRWINEFGFPMDMILEACRRTITSISSPSLPYTESILKHWKDSSVFTLAALQDLDKSYKSEKAAAKRDLPTASKATRRRNFTERDEDFNAIALKIMEKQQSLSANN